MAVAGGRGGGRGRGPATEKDGEFIRDKPKHQLFRPKLLNSDSGCFNLSVRAVTWKFLTAGGGSGQATAWTSLAAEPSSWPCQDRPSMAE